LAVGVDYTFQLLLLTDHLQSFFENFSWNTNLYQALENLQDNHLVSRLSANN